MKLDGKRLLIIEEGLRNHDAHFFTWIKAIRQINQAAGAEVLVAGHQRVITEIREELDVKPIYSHNNWEGMYNYPNPLRRYGAVFLHNWRVYRQTLKLLRETGRVDCIELAAARIHHLLAWYWLCRRFLGKKFNRLVIFILTSEGYYDDDMNLHFKKSSFFIKMVLKWFRPWVESGRVCFAADSHVTADQYEQLAGIPFRLFPSPGVALQKWDSARRDDERKGTVFVLLGVSYYDKGMNIMQDAVIKFLSRNPESNCRFIIQWAKETIAPNGDKIEIDERLRNAPQVTLIETVLNAEDYKNYLLSADCIVLPYRRYVYFNRISGVAVEASCAGIPLIVTENTWLSWAVEKFGAGLTIRDGDAADLCCKLEEFEQRKDDLQQLAVKRKAVALDYNSSDKYLDCLWRETLS